MAGFTPVPWTRWSAELRRGTARDVRVRSSAVVLAPGHGGSVVVASSSAAAVRPGDVVVGVNGHVLAHDAEHRTVATVLQRALQPVALSVIADGSESSDDDDGGGDGRAGSGSSSGDEDGSDGGSESSGGSGDEAAPVVRHLPSSPVPRSLSSSSFFSSLMVPAAAASPAAAPAPAAAAASPSYFEQFMSSIAPAMPASPRLGGRKAKKKKAKAKAKTKPAVEAAAADDAPPPMDRSGSSDGEAVILQQLATTGALKTHRIHGASLPSRPPTALTPPPPQGALWQQLFRSLHSGYVWCAEQCLWLDHVELQWLELKASPRHDKLTRPSTVRAVRAQPPPHTRHTRLASG